jgi:osmoprotectant transport system permease protein
MVDSTTILAGAIPAALLALTADGLLAWIEHRLQSGRAAATTLGPAAAGVLALAAILAWPMYSRSSAAPIVVGSKNFTEQVVLGELIAQALEARGLPVARKLNLGGTFICDRALRSGDVDVYVEYTGTAVSAVFHETVPHDPREAFDRARELYAQGGITVLDPLGFNNTFAILVRGRDARTLRLQSIDDLRQVAARWTPGFGYEFLQRQDGYPGLVKTYGLTFGRQPRAMDLSLIYKALADGQVDVIAGDATSALITSFDLIALEDTRRYFPPYDAVPIVRTSALRQHPEIAEVLSRLAGRISADDMRAMNAAVDVDKRDPAAVAKGWRERR